MAKKPELYVVHVNHRGKKKYQPRTHAGELLWRNKDHPWGELSWAGEVPRYRNYAFATSVNSPPTYREAEPELVSSRFKATRLAARRMTDLRRKQDEIFWRADR